MLIARNAYVSASAAHLWLSLFACSSCATYPIDTEHNALRRMGFKVPLVHLWMKSARCGKPQYGRQYVY